LRNCCSAQTSVCPTGI